MTTVKETSSIVKTLQIEAAKRINASLGIPGLAEDIPGLADADPHVPREVLGWGTGAVSLAMMLLLKKQKMVFPETKNGNMEYIASPCSGWNMLGRDELLPIVQAVATSSLDENFTRRADKVIQWLKDAPHFTKEYCKDLKMKCFRELIEFVTKMSKEFSDIDVISVEKVNSFYKQHGNHLVLDFHFQQITSFDEIEIHSFESLLRHVNLERHASAPFNDIFYLEKHEKEFWTTFKKAEVEMIVVGMKILKKDINMNVGKSDLLSIGTMAKEKGLLALEIKENEEWTESSLHNYKIVAKDARALLDDCTLYGNHGMWSKDQRKMRKDFIKALHSSKGIKLELTCLQEFTFSCNPLGRLNTNEFAEVIADREKRHQWFKNCGILSIILKYCQAHSKIIVLEMTLNTSLAHHNYFIQYMMDLDVYVLEMMFQGGSAYANAFHLLEWSMLAEIGATAKKCNRFLAKKRQRALWNAVRKWRPTCNDIHVTILLGDLLEDEDGDGMQGERFNLFKNEWRQQEFDNANVFSFLLPPRQSTLVSRDVGQNFLSMIAVSQQLSLLYEVNAYINMLGLACCHSDDQESIEVWLHWFLCQRKILVDVRKNMSQRQSEVCSRLRIINTKISNFTVENITQPCVWFQSTAGAGKTRFLLAEKQELVSHCNKWLPNKRPTHMWLDEVTMTHCFACNHIGSAMFFGDPMQSTNPESHAGVSRP